MIVQCVCFPPCTDSLAIPGGFQMHFCNAFPEHFIDQRVQWKVPPIILYITIWSHWGCVLALRSLFRSLIPLPGRSSYWSWMKWSSGLNLIWPFSSHIYEGSLICTNNELLCCSVLLLSRHNKRAAIVKCQKGSTLNETDLSINSALLELY